MSSTGPGSRSLPPARVVALVTGRELSARLRSRTFLLSNALLVVVIVGGIVLTSVLTDSDDPARVGVVGQAELLAGPLTAAGQALGTPVTAVSVTDEQSARDQISAGDLPVVLVPVSGGGYLALTDRQVPVELRAVLDAAVRQQAVDAALAAEGVDPEELAAATTGAVVTVDALNPPDPDSGQRTALAYVSVLLLYFQLLTTGIAVATGVVEEKTSRVVELLLSTIKPLHLLTGKVLGIGLVGLVQLTAYGLAGLTAALGTGLITVTGTAVGVFAGTLGWYVLGFAFLAVLYAAAGSLVSRQEEVGGATAPLTVLVVGMFLVAQASVQDPGGTLSSVLSWIPPFSAILMPLRMAAGVTGPGQVVGTALLMVLTTSLLAVLAARIYRRSVLRTGTRVGWKQALGRS